MKILHLTSYSWENGGPAQIVHDHAKQQQQMGHEVHILSPYNDSTNFYPLPQNIKLIKCRYHWFSKFFPEFSVETWRYLQKNNHEYGLIHMHGVWNFAGLAPFLFPTKAIRLTTIHGTLGSFTLNKGRWKKNISTWVFQRKILKKNDILHVNHPKELLDLDAYLKERHPHVLVLPNGIDMELYQSVSTERKAAFRAKYNITKHKKIVLFLGRIDKKKGIDLLMPAFDLVAQKCPEAVLLLIGPDYGMLEFVQQFIEEKKLGDKIIVAGMLKGEEKLEAFSCADVFTLPTYSEGFSIAVLEALSAALPVVVSSETGFSEIIADYQAGIIVQHTPKSVADGIVLLLEDENLQRKMSENAQKLIQEKYSIEKIAQELVEKVQELKNATT